MIDDEGATKRKGPPLPASIRKRERKAALKKGLHCKIANLHNQLEQLTLDNSQQRNRFDLVREVCLAGDLAAQFLVDLAKARSGDSQGASEPPPCRAISSLEENISMLMEQVFQGEREHLEEWYPAKACPGCMDDLVSSFILPERLDGPLHASLLTGGPLSLAHSALLCLRFDPQLQEAIAEWMANPVEGSQKVKQHMRQAQAPVAAAVQKRNGQAVSRDLVYRAVCNTLKVTSKALGLVLLDPLRACTDMMRNPQGEIHLPPAAHLDMVTKELGLSNKQLMQLLEGLRVINKLQQPLNKQEAQVNATMHKLLGDNPASPAGSEAASSTSGSARAAGTWDWPRQGGAEQEQAVLRQSPEPPPSSAAAAAAAAGKAPCQFWAIEGEMASLDTHKHQELLRLTQQLGAIQHKLVWLDSLASIYAAGQLTWKQLAQFTMLMHPYTASVLLWSRRLSTRASLQVPLS